METSSDSSDTSIRFILERKFYRLITVKFHQIIFYRKLIFFDKHFYQ
jgi:hypothetical protein